MECNRDEATRAKEIAERKFTMRDISGAKKFAIKAQNLFPELEGISQMLATLDIYISAENKIGGEPDWYGVLGVNPLADDETVKKQYRKLALVLHPDKNKSIGAEGAFKFISEAWSSLSDKTRRLAYDQKRVLKTSQQKVPSSTTGPAGEPTANGFQNFTTTSSNTKARKTTNKRNSAPAPPAPVPRPSKPNTFWTACNRCKMQYEYLRVYLHHNLLCPNCHEPFYASETAPPPLTGSNSSTPWSSSSKQRQNSNHVLKKNSSSTGRKADASMGSNGQSGPFSGTDGAAQAERLLKQAYDKVKREREEAEAAARRQEALRRKNHVSKRTASNSSTGLTSDLKGEKVAKKRKLGEEIDGNASRHMASENGGMGSANLSVKANSRLNGTRELAQFELRNVWTEKAKLEIRKKLDEWKSASAGMATEKEKGKVEIIEQEKPKDTNAVKTGATDQNKGIESTDVKKGFHDKASVDGYENLINKARESMSITVPDPDFHDFDRDRSEKSFGANQVWAAYDDDNGMPRYYAMIHTVMSVNPFKMKISWLNSRTSTELGPLNWTGSGFSKTCGDFRVGRYEVNKSLNSFSHKVKWTKGRRGAVRIFPRKGDVWAVYRNWSPDWNELTSDEVIHKYDMVEVLEDYNEDHGVLVTPLVKVAGFKTVFHRHLDPREIRSVPREEMFRFSHQVPSYLLTGSEAEGAPKGCRELDPAATPIELLQVITEAKEEMVENTEEQTVDKPKEADLMEISKDSIRLETNEEKIVPKPKEQEIVEIADDEMIEIPDKEMVGEPKEVDFMEIVDEHILTNDVKQKVVNSGDETMEIGEKEKITEAREKTTENDNKQKVTEAMDEVVENGKNHKASETGDEIVENGDKQKVIAAKDEVSQNV